MTETVRAAAMISSALNGLQKALKDMQQPAKELSGGKVTADSVTKLKLSGQNIRIQKITLQTALEVNKHIIDLLA